MMVIKEGINVVMDYISNRVQNDVMLNDDMLNLLTNIFIRLSVMNDDLEDRLSEVKELE